MAIQPKAYFKPTNQLNCGFFPFQIVFHQNLINKYSFCTHLFRSHAQFDHRDENETFQL